MRKSLLYAIHTLFLLISKAVKLLSYDSCNSSAIVFTSGPSNISSGIRASAGASSESSDQSYIFCNQNRAYSW